jgi:hypothetical protein
MTWTRLPATVAIGAAMLLAGGTARADQWTDQTTLKFDAPVMIPGRTLPPGTYVFKLGDSAVDRSTVRIFDEDQSRLIATVLTVPIRRLEVTGDVAIRFAPPEGDAPVALKGWFYPGSRQGHEFVYPSEEARRIAERTKTLVLSSDRPGDMSGGTIFTFDATGGREAWRGDPRILREWRDWSRASGTTAARVAEPGSGADRDSTAPMMRSQPAGMTVSLGELEEHPTKYVGQQITVTGEVDDVFGRRLFKIDEQNWADLDRELLVYLPSDLAALVRDDDVVTVSGTLRHLSKGDIEQQIAWLRPSTDASARLTMRPVLVADTIVGGTSDVALAVRVRGGGEQPRPVGTSGSRPADSDALRDLASLVRQGREAVGRHVSLDDLRVSRVVDDQGFWVEGATDSIFVRPAGNRSSEVVPQVGESVSVEGVVLQMPRSLRHDARAHSTNPGEVYVSATSVQ